jgi:hypothetical protein
MNPKIEEIVIDGKTYVPKEESKVNSFDENGFTYVLVRTYSAGAFVGYLQKKESTLAGVEVRLLKSRRLWYWDGAASLSQLAIDGVSKPQNCKFPEEEEWKDLIAIEISPVSEKAKKSIKSVGIWKM